MPFLPVGYTVNTRPEPLLIAALGAGGRAFKSPPTTSSPIPSLPVRGSVVVRNRILNLDFGVLGSGAGRVGNDSSNRAGVARRLCMAVKELFLPVSGRL